jgi:hypothetical protein
MTSSRASEIVAIYDAIEEGEEDISTEQLLQRTADTAKCDVDDVLEAMLKAGRV